MQKNKAIHPFIEKLWLEEKWAELILICRIKWNRKAWLYLKRNKNAVQRIKQVFTELSGRHPYDTEINMKYWDEQIAKYLDRLGVAALISDMKAAFQANPKIKSIVYFLWSKDNRPRWELLLMRKLEEDYAKQKEKDNDAYAYMARLLGLENKQMGIQLAPDWVVEARRNLKSLEMQLKAVRGNTEKLAEIKRDINRIKHNLDKFGYTYYP